MEACIAFLVDSKVLENELVSNFSIKDMKIAQRAWLLVNHPDKSSNPLASQLVIRVRECLEVVRPFAKDYFVAQTHLPIDVSFTSWYSVVMQTLVELIETIFPSWVPEGLRTYLLFLLPRFSFWCMIYTYKNWGNGKMKVKQFLKKYGHKADFLVDTIPTLNFVTAKSKSQKRRSSKFKTPRSRLSIKHASLKHSKK